MEVNDQVCGPSYLTRHTEPPFTHWTLEAVDTTAVSNIGTNRESHSLYREHTSDLPAPSLRPTLTTVPWYIYCIYMTVLLAMRVTP